MPQFLFGLQNVLWGMCVCLDWQLYLIYSYSSLVSYLREFLVVRWTVPLLLLPWTRISQSHCSFPLPSLPPRVPSPWSPRLLLETQQTKHQNTKPAAGESEPLRRIIELCLMTSDFSKNIQSHMWLCSFSMLPNHQMRHQALCKVGCQPLKSPSGVCVGYHGHFITPG